MLIYYHHFKSIVLSNKLLILLIKKPNKQTTIIPVNIVKNGIKLFLIADNTAPIIGTKIVIAIIIDWDKKWCTLTFITSNSFLKNNDNTIILIIIIEVTDKVEIYHTL